MTNQVSRHFSGFIHVLITRAAPNAALFGEGIFVTYGNKNKIMYWGGLRYYISIRLFESVHKLFIIYFVIFMHFSQQANSV